MPFPPERNHKIPLEAAAALTRRYRQGAGRGAPLATLFPNSVFESLMAEPGCAGVRIYYGQGEAGQRELILVGVDGEGNDMTSAQVYDYGIPCPPYCGNPDVLNGE